jgi:hypothetical protein
MMNIYAPLVISGYCSKRLMQISQSMLADNLHLLIAEIIGYWVFCIQIQDVNDVPFAAEKRRKCKFAERAELQNVRKD